MKYKRRGIAAALTAAMLFGVCAPAVNAAPAAEDGFLLYDGTAVCLYVDADQTGKTEFAQVQRAAEDVSSDFEKVTGKAAVLVDTAEELSGRPVIAGTLGHSDLIDSLAEDGKLDTAAIEGQWEAFTIQVVDNPVSGVDEALVIAGSDKRGSIYGLYELSEAIGVSPWTWWGDVPVERQSRIVLDESIEKTEMPDVKYRGIFINDEANFQYWSRALENDTDSPGQPNANTYATIFELLLRLKANTLWPAMHEYSDPFNKYINPNTGASYNAEMADRYGIVMGTSHCEILLRDNATEWAPWCEENEGKYNLVKVNNSWNSSYDYTVNPEAMNAYWEEAVARNYKFENMYTMGLRGVHDGSMLCSNLADTSPAGKAAVVKKAVEAQVAILEKYEKKLEEETGEPQNFLKVYCSYKEAAQHFQFDISLPEDTVIIWGDDNYGYVREVSSESELAKFPNAGVYYHVSYLGSPLSYLWTATTPLHLIYEEMRKSYDAGSDDVWVLNVGDLKPAEIPMEFFLTMGWDVDRYDDTTISDYLAGFAGQNFNLDDSAAAKVAEALETYYQVAFLKKPEYFSKSPGTNYNLVNFGDEAQLLINRMAAAVEQSQAVYDGLPAEYKDAYFQMVQYMLRAYLFSMEKYVYAEKNQLYYEQGRFASVNAYGQAALDAYDQILADLKYYNKTMSDGKWDGIIDPYNGTRTFPTISGEPEVVFLGEESAVAGIGSVCEGQSTGNENVTLSFHSLTDDNRFIDVFNTGLTPETYTIEADDALVITRADGSAFTGSATVEVEERLTVSVDWSKVSNGTHTASITVKDTHGYEKTYPVELTKEAADRAKKGYFMTGTEMSIEAEHYSDNVSVNGMSWELMEGLGRDSDVMKSYPDLSSESVRIDSNFETTSPYLEYNVYFSETGTYDVFFYRLPTLDEGADHSCRTAFQFDDGQIYLFRGNSKVDNEYGNTAWRLGVVDNTEVLKHDTGINVTTAGWHTIRIYRSDAGAVFDKLVLRSREQNARSSLLGAPEGYTTTADYEAPGIGLPPVFSLDDITYADESPAKSYLFDFRADPENASTGYIGVDNQTQSSPAMGFAWEEGFDSLQVYTRSVDKTSARDKGFITSREDATLTLNLGRAGKYVVGMAMGDRQSGGIAVNDMAVSANGTALISGLDVPAGRTVERGFVVEVGEDGKLQLDLSGNAWILSALEVAAYNQPNMDDGDGAFIPDGSGNINIEAETVLEDSEYAYRQTGTDSYPSTWEETYGSSGTAMYAGPNVNGSFTSTDINGNKGAKMFYKINFAEAGSYTVYLLVKTQDDDDDSIQISLDNGAPATLNDTKDTGGQFTWFKGPSINVSSAGEHTLAIWEREDGFVLDKIILTRGAADYEGKMCREGASVDRSELDALIEEAEGLNEDDYLADTYAMLEAALRVAKSLGRDATQADIDNAIRQLQQAMNGLINASVIGADIATGLVGQYTFDGNWKNSLDQDEEALPSAGGTTNAPTITQDASRGQVARVYGGGASTASTLSMPNPMQGDDLSDGMTVAFWFMGNSLGNYEMAFTANDGVNTLWLSSGLYFGYMGSRGYIDVNKENNLPGPADKQNYLQTGQWYHMAITFTEEEAVVYINGKPFLSTADKNYTVGYNTDDLTRMMDVLRLADSLDLGGSTDYWGSGNFYADDFLIYDRALTADQAARLSLSMVDKSQLLEAIEEARAEAAKTDVYLPESIAAYVAEIELAEEVAFNESATDLMVASAYDRLIAAKSLLRTVADEDKAAAAVEALIDALPAASQVTEDDAEDIRAARAAYEALTSYGREQVGNLDKLTAAEVSLYELQGGPIVDNLVCHDEANALNWVIRTNAQIGTQAYSDRTITFRTLPDVLKGKDWIRTAMNSKLWSEDDSLSEFDVLASTDMYVGLDRVVGRPDWLSDEAGFEDTGMTIELEGTDSVLQLYKRPVYAGEHVQLGYVGMDRACYLVFFDHATAVEEELPRPQKELSRQLKVACVGDSITYGSGSSNRDTTSYPPQLQEMLGDSYDVRNFGIGGATLMNNTDKPYTAQPEYQASLDFQPDIVIIMLGTNDSKPKNSDRIAAAYKDDFLALIESYQNLSSNPKIYIATSPYVMGHRDNPGSNDIISEVVAEEIVPLQKELAQETGLECIDIHAATYQQSIFPDDVHPNDEGYRLIAGAFYDALFNYLPRGVTAARSDVSDLNALLASADALKEADYTAKSWAALQRIVDYAAALDNTVRQSDVDWAVQALEDAIAGLVEREDPFQKGDLNKDNAINIQDIMSLCRVLARQATGNPPTDEERELGDMNGDSRIDIQDVMSLCRVLARQSQ